MSTDDDTLTGITKVIRSEFMEIPGLVLTRDQIRRLWAIDPEIAHQVIAQLLQSGFLRVGAHGRYSRADLGRP
jgi:hypothetical protein